MPKTTEDAAVQWNGEVKHDQYPYNPVTLAANPHNTHTTSKPSPQYTTEDALQISLREKEIHNSTKHKLSWPESEVSLLRALHHKCPEISNRELAHKFQELLVPGTLWKPNETQIMKKISKMASQGRKSDNAE
ncbi:hypothetical protein HDV00_011877 [Rhizophlyctis rosea]|nr:hypothetical protein HDV00_011877 [Rhizophlyctis rosea]